MQKCPPTSHHNSHIPVISAIRPQRSPLTPPLHLLIKILVGLDNPFKEKLCPRPSTISLILSEKGVAI